MPMFCFICNGFLIYNFLFQLPYIGFKIVILLSDFVDYRICTISVFCTLIKVQSFLKIGDYRILSVDADRTLLNILVDCPESADLLDTVDDLSGSIAAISD